MDSTLSFKNSVFLLLLTLFLFSCASRKDIVYYQGIDNASLQKKSNSYEIKIQPDDLLMIIVSAEDSEIAPPFNLKTYSTVNPSRQDVVGAQTTQFQWFYRFPILARPKVSGMERSQVIQLLQDKIFAYIKNPIINLRIMNFKISV